MNTVILYSTVLATLLLAFTSATAGYKTCAQPPYAAHGQYAGRNQECAALVQSKCPGVGLTSSWSRGIRVKGNCSTLPGYIAIATFEGPNNTYNTPQFKKQHTAIFVSCDSTGITVYDQYRNSGGVKKRVLRYGGNGVNNGDLFYAIL